MAKPEFKWIYDSARWSKLRLRILHRDGYKCMMCYTRDPMRRKVNIAKVVDHKVPVDVDMSKAFDEKNLWSLCHNCHTEKTATDKRRQRGDVVGYCEHGYPLGAVKESGDILCCPYESAGKGPGQE